MDGRATGEWMDGDGEERDGQTNLDATSVNEREQ